MRDVPGKRLTLSLALLLNASGGADLLAPNQTAAQDPQTRLQKPLRDIPSERLNFSFVPDSGVEHTQHNVRDGADNSAAASVRADFESRRKREALIRTVTSPGKLQVLALYMTESENDGSFRIALYDVEGRFIRELMPAAVKGSFPEKVSWSPDGAHYAFVGLKDAGASAGSNSSEQIYVCGGESLTCKPLTKRDGAIHFHFSWSADGLHLVTLDCSESEWSDRLQSNLLPAGRPRLVSLKGGERLLSDELTDVAPAWSPDGSKLAVAHGTDVIIHDAAQEEGTSLRIPLREPFMAASITYDEKNLRGAVKGKSGAGMAGDGSRKSPPGSAPLSFNPIIALAWPAPELILIETGFVRIYGVEGLTKRYSRWHRLLIERRP
jgi:hypothetical protein